MGGLLTRAIGGAMVGAGAAMVDQAKAAREDAIAALKRAGEVEDRDTNIAATAHNAAVAQQAETYRAGMANQTSRDNAQGAEWTSEMNNIDNNETSRQNTKDTIKAEGERQAGGFKHDDGKVTSTIQTSDGTVFGITANGAKPLTDGNGNALVAKDKGTKITPQQAQEIALKQWSAYSGGTEPNKDGTLPVHNVDGSEAAKGAWVASYAKRLLDGNGTPTPLATGSGLVRTPDSQAAVGTPPPPPTKTPVAPPALAKIPGLQFSPSKNQYRDPATNKTYDANGNPVQ